MSNIDNTALYKISYGLYALTTNDGTRDNAMILNTAVQVTDTPLQLAVCINNNNYSCETVKKTKKMNLNCLDTRASFEVFKKFGFVAVDPDHAPNFFECKYCPQYMVDCFPEVLKLEI